ncbi:MAG: Hpt domain-containing protein [Bryobacteraceae bacterium]
MARVDTELMKGFWDEARAYLPDMERRLGELRVDPANSEARTEMYRLAHNLRGASAMIGLDEVSQMAETLEELLEQVGTGFIRFDAETADLVGESLTHMRMSLQEPGAQKPQRATQRPETETPEASPELVEGFVEEAEEHLQTFAHLIGNLRPNCEGSDFLQEIRRSVHTIKGAAGMVGLKTVSQLAHRMEDVLDQLYEGTAAFSEAIKDTLLRSHDLLAELVEARGRTHGLEAAISALFNRYETLLSEPDKAPGAAAEAAVTTAAQTAPAPEEPEAERNPQVDSNKLVRVPLERLEDLVRLSSELFIHRSSLEQQLTRYNRELGELNLSLQRLRRLTARLDTEHASLFAMSQSLPGFMGAGPDRSEFDALEFDRYTEVHLIARELAEAVSDISSASSQFSYFAVTFENYTGRQGRLSGEVQDKVMKLRMVPLATLASRLERTVRVTARERGKLARFVLEHGEAEIDKVVLERIAGALEHLLRNSVDHGIEAPDLRIASGKLEHGFVRLRADYDGTEVTLTLSDDGAGIDTAKIRQKALELGILNADEAEALTEDDAMHLVFVPGLTTAATLSDISGRGVGLDSVKATVESLRGAVNVESSRGEGTTFRIRLPLTLAVTSVTMVRSGGNQYALPVTGHTRSTAVPATSIVKADERETVEIDGQIHQVVRLADALGHTAGKQASEVPIVQVRLTGQDYALVVDEVLEATQVVVKALSPWLRKAPCVSAATVMGDGRVVLILNPTELFQRRIRNVTPLQRRQPQVPKTLEVLIVDDSISVRRVIANLIKNTGWNPSQAKDGVEALELLNQGDYRPDVILMDIEMPRMDGYELTTRLRATQAWRNVPIIMLTSRAGDKHRAKAFTAGVTDYLVKPYQDKTLLGAIRRHVDAAKGKTAR